VAQQDLINAIVREVMSELNGGAKSASSGSASTGGKLHYKSDYPLAKKRPELVKTPTGKSLDEITLDRVVSGEIKPEEIRITPEALEYQAQICESIDRPQMVKGLRRAAELTKVPDERILEIYNALRPNRSSKEELLAVADELQNKYGARLTADFVREAAHVYEKRDVLKKDW
jgi:propanediol dehydratase small subunit